MSVIISVKYTVDTDRERSRPWAQPAETPTITLNNDPSDYVVPVAAGATAVLWNPGQAEGAQLPLDFKFLLLRTDSDVVIEFTCNNTNTNERVFAVKLAANIPLMLGSNVGFYNFVAGPDGDAFAGTLDVLDKIRAKNLSDTANALVNVVIGT